MGTLVAETARLALTTVLPEIWSQWLSCGSTLIDVVICECMDMGKSPSSILFITLTNLPIDLMHVLRTSKARNVAQRARQTTSCPQISTPTFPAHSY